MAGNSLQLVWDLVARDNASPAFAKVGAVAEETAGKTEAASSKLSGALPAVAKAAGLGAAAFAVVSVKMAADFQSATTRLVTSANESQSNLKMVQQGMLDMAGQLGYSTEELSTAMYKVESGGQHGAAGLATLKAAAQGAKTENADLTTVADALTSAMTDYHLPASQAADVTSKLVAATASGKMTFEELSGSMAAILPVASANHVSLNDILGDLASMTMHGMSAEQASQNLADAIRHMAAPTQMQSKELAALGLSATQLSGDLGTKGLSGTINEISKAIEDRMGPGTSQIVLDLNTALAKVPPSVRELGQGVLDGTVTMKDFRGAIKGMPVEQAALAQSFLALVSGTHQLGAETKSGSEVYQSYSGALRQAMGDATGMNVALMIGGENAKNTTTAIANVSKATAEAGGNVKGWSEIQGTFNQQASETVHSLEAMTIEAGTHLLPALTGALGYVNRDGIPALKGLASGASDAAHWFGELPGPVKDVALALGALTAANMLGITGALATGASKIGDGFATAKTKVSGFGDEMKLQQALGSMEAASLTELDRALGATAGAADTAGASMSRAQMAMRGYDTALAETVVEQDVAAASTGRLNAALSTGLAAGVAGAKSAGSGLLSMLGGPWGAAMLGATIAVTAVVSSIQKAKETQQGWTAALEQGGQASAEAQRAMDAQDATVRKSSEGFMGFISKIDGYNLAQKAKTASTTDATKAAQDHYNSLGLVDQKTLDLTNAEYGLQVALKGHAADSLYVTEATNKVKNAQKELTDVQNLLNSSTQTAAEKAQQLSQNELALVGNSLAVKQSFDQFTSSLQQYKKDAADPASASTNNLKLEQDALNTSALSVAQAASTAGTAWAKSNGIQDTGTASSYAQLLALEKVQKAMGTDTPAAVSTLIASLTDATSKGHLTAAQMDGITAAVDGIPGQKKVDVTADTSQAESTINGFLKAYQNVQYTGSSITVNGRVVAKADGGYISGPGSGTSDSIPALLSNGEYVVKASSVSQHGVAALDALNAGQAAVLPRFADGGIVDRFPVSPSQAMLDSIQAVAPAALPAGSGVERWRSLVLQALGMDGQPASLANTVLRRMNQESGGDPAIVNRWDSNWAKGTPSVGLMQVIGPTYRAHADKRRNVGPYLYGTSIDPLSNVLASFDYAKSAYGSLAAAFNRAGGYANGGTTPAGAPFWVGERGPELMWRDRQQYVSTAAQSAAVATSPSSAPQFTVHVQIGDETIEAKTVRVVDSQLGALVDTIHYAGT